jgi:hypothetical protein
MTKLIVAFRKFANAPKKKKREVLSVHSVQAYTGSRGIAPLSLNLRPAWR